MLQIYDLDILIEMICAVVPLPCVKRAQHGQNRQSTDKIWDILKSMAASGFKKQNSTEQDLKRRRLEFTLNI